jgi:hypothetical protein
MIVDRRELRDKLASLLTLLQRVPPFDAAIAADAAGRLAGALEALHPRGSAGIELGWNALRRSKARLGQREPAR